MRFRELYLKAFGPFTERRLVFGDSNEEPAGLCLIYGANEAGKSSALRAVHDLLYEIPARTTDDFVHKKQELRIGGRVVFADGEEVAFVRRKKPGHTLLEFSLATGDKSQSERPIESARLLELIASIPEAVFGNFYGLDHAELSQGSEALLEDDGEIGRALFAAGLGSGNLRNVLESMDAEAEVLFTPLAKKRKINTALKSYKEIREQIKNKSLGAATWAEASGEVEQVDERLAALASDIEGHNADVVRLGRIRTTLPLLATHAQALEAVTQISDVPILAEGFEDRLQAARDARTIAIEQQASTMETVSRLEAKIENLEIHPELIQYRDEIQRLLATEGGYRDLFDHLPIRRRKLDGLQAEVNSVLETMGHHVDGAGESADLAQYRSAHSREKSLREMARQQIQGEANLNGAKEKKRVAERDLARARDVMSAAADAGDPTPLRRAIERAKRLGDIDDRIANLRSECMAASEECERSLARLEYWGGDLDRVDQVAFPSVETIERFADSSASIQRDGEKLEEAFERVEARSRELRNERDGMEAEGEVPSDAERDRRRAARDATWQTLRTERGRPVEELNGALPDRFEAEVDSADQIADRLRDDAKRVARAAQLGRDLAAAEAEKAEIHEAQQEWRKRETDFDSQWSAVWREFEIDPGTPLEMRAWSERLRRLCDETQHLRSFGRDLDTACEDRDAALAELRDTLSDGQTSEALPERTSERLDDAIAVTDTTLQKLEDAVREVDRNTADESKAVAHLGEAEVEYGRLLEAQEALLRDWRVAVSGLGLSESPRPIEVDERLSSLNALFSLLKERDELADRVAKMSTDIARFESSLQNLLSRCAADCLADGVDILESVGVLRNRLSEAEQQEATRLQSETELQEGNEKKTAAQRALAIAIEELDVLRAEASIEDEADFQVAIAQSRARAEASRQLDAAEAQLVEAGEGRAFDELAVEAKSVDRDALSPRIAALTSELEVWGEEREQILERRGELNKALEQMGGGGEVAELAAEGQAILATLASDTRRYATLCLARGILAREIDQYRERNQGPVLGRAAELFSRLTVGRYPDIESVFGDGGRPELRAVDTEGEKKSVGQLSTGTRDQLFLALRLATLEATAERGETLPLIADDILVEFDDERSRATLAVLADLSQKTQILLFSHHRHVLEQARELEGQAAIVEL